MKKLLFSMLILASGLSLQAVKPKPKAQPKAAAVAANPFAEIEKMLASLDVAAGKVDTNMQYLKNALTGLEAKLAAIGPKIKLLGIEQKIEMTRACRKLTTFTQTLRKEYEGTFYYIPDLLKSDDVVVAELQGLQRRIDKCSELVNNLSWYKNPLQYTWNAVRHPIYYMQEHKKMTALVAALLAREAIKAYHYGNLPTGQTAQQAGGWARWIACGY